jgi:DNA-binding GntR family transcriptional regulator
VAVEILVVPGRARSNRGSSKFLLPRAARSQLSRPTASKLTDRLVTDGLAERVRAGRRVDVTLTARGARAYDLLVAAGHRMVQEATAGWGEQEVDSFRDHLARFVHIVATTDSSERRVKDE